MEEKSLYYEKAETLLDKNFEAKTLISDDNHKITKEKEIIIPTTCPSLKINEKKMESSYNMKEGNYQRITKYLSTISTKDSMQ